MVFVTAAARAEEKRTLAFSALIDGYYSWNGNRPASRANQLRLYDAGANAFRLSFVRLGVDREADPLGFRVEIGAGRAYTLLHSTDPAPRILDYLPQAYLKWKPGPLAGLQLDVGKFYTSAGAEAFDTSDNWNYSRSLLFSLAIPGYHFGFRSSVPLHRHLTVGAQLVNGCNNVKDNNRGKTIGLTAAFTGTKASWFHNYYAGPEKTGSDKGWRQLYDTTVLLTPRSRLAFYGNFDYGLERRLDGGADRWLGVAGAARVGLTDRLSLSPRLEWFHDADGFTTGAAQRLKESTVTGEWKAGKVVSVRLEYRRDWSDRPFFDRRGQGGAVRSQTTVLAGLIAFLSQKR